VARSAADGVLDVSSTLFSDEPATEYFAAANTDDADCVAACFAEDAVVRDEGGDIHGRSAIRAWAEEVRRKYDFHAEVIAVEEAAGRTVVTAHLTGDFPGNPVDLTYRFKFGPEITALEIS
jgi:ketosteroid isomerase-like protein